MSERVSGWLPLSGVLFALLSAVSIVITPSSPGASASGARVIAFYEQHRSVERVSVLVAVFAVGFLMVFATVLRGHLRAHASEGLGTLVLVGAGLLTVGLTVSGGFAYALADVPHRLVPATAQTLNLLDEDVFFTAFVGAGLFGLASGLALLRGARLPRWLGWLALLIGVASFTPFTIGPALLAISIWVLVVSILIYRRSEEPDHAPVESSPAETAARSSETPTVLVNRVTGPATAGR